MPAQKVVLAGDKDASEVLEADLRASGVEARFHPADGLVEALQSIERELEGNRPDAAVAVGTGAASLALAITAGKLGVPLAACLGDAASGDEADRRRILATLASLEVGPDSGDAANRIASWLGEDRVMRL